MQSIPHGVGWTAIMVQCDERLEPVLKALKKKKMHLKSQQQAL